MGVVLVSFLVPTCVRFLYWGIRLNLDSSRKVPRWGKALYNKNDSISKDSNPRSLVKDEGELTTPAHSDWRDLSLREERWSKGGEKAGKWAESREKAKPEGRNYGFFSLRWGRVCFHWLFFVCFLFCLLVSWSMWVWFSILSWWVIEWKLESYMCTVFVTLWFCQSFLMSLFCW